MEEQVMMPELWRKISEAPSAKNLKKRSISAVRRWSPGCGHYSPDKLSSCYGLPQLLDVSAIPKELDNKLEEGEITPVKIPLDKEQNSNSARKASGGIEESEDKTEELLVTKGHNGNFVVENDGGNNQWWMRSKVCLPPKRRLISAIRRYPPGCGRNLESTVAGFDMAELEREKVNDMNEAIIVDKDGEAVSDGEVCLTGTVNDAGFRHVVDKHAKRKGFNGKTMYLETDTFLVKYLEREKEKNRVLSLSAAVKDMERVKLEEKTGIRGVERNKVNSKVSCAERGAEGDTVKGKGISSTVDSTQNKVVKSIKVKILFKEPFESQRDRAKGRTGRDDRLAIRKPPMKFIRNKRVGVKRFTSNYNPYIPRTDWRESGDEGLEEYASCAILQSRIGPSKIHSAKKPVAKVNIYHSDLSKAKHDNKVAMKSKPQQQATSKGHDGHPQNTVAKVNIPTDPRAKVKRCLRLFQIIFRNLLQEVESGKKLADMERNRIDLKTAQILGKIHETLNRGKPVVGSVPGVEVGDEYRYRAELSVLGLHRPPQGGIDSTMSKGLRIATSIVASGGYSDNIESSDLLIYTGAGGKPTGKPGHTEPEDQKMERGNLALKNSVVCQTPVRVIHGMNTSDTTKVVMTFTYDGLYRVERYWSEIETYMVRGMPMSAKVFRFLLRRLPGQPELNWNKLMKVQRSKVREGLCLKDISQGREKLPICVINTIDNEKPRQFQYVTKTVYPSWYEKSRPKGCNCNGQCSDAQTCSCAVKNGGQIPFNLNGAIVRAKPLIYECGPACGCPPTCPNRVSQHGIKFPLEIFKTKTRGWGVHSVSSIPSGSFVCEYVGELLRDHEAEQRENDEYLFDIGNNYNDSALWEGLPSDITGIDTQEPSTDNGAGSSEGNDEQEGFTIDALAMGNVGRFLNHSCSPNLFAQNVLFDHDDKKMPHIMFFAAENIPPLKELTYHYNYKIGMVSDSLGNEKVKDCYCRSSVCPQRLY